MLDRALNQPQNQRRVFLAANPDRFAAGQALLRSDHEIDLFLLDDGFQHRRVRRDFDLVLISAMNPFGFGHVLPRGLLREPLRGLCRADAVVITHADRVDETSIGRIETRIRQFNPVAPIYRAVHAPVGLLSDESPQVPLPLDQLSARRFFAFSGIGNPGSFEDLLRRFGSNMAGRRRFDDHHRYRPADLEDVSREARDGGAEVLVTTEKDWVKIEQFPRETPILRLAVRVEFAADHEQRLLDQIRRAVASGPAK